jgi:ribosomal protein L34
VNLSPHMREIFDLYARWEPARHKAEVAWFVRQAKDKGREWAEGFLAQVATKRGQDAADKLREDGRKAWKTT